jgi:hypothetical protein
MLDVDTANPVWFGFRDGRHRIIRSLHVGDRFFESEGTGSKYWGSYSKDPTVYNYIRIGEYSTEMKAEMLARTDRYLDRGQGYMLASSWLQSIPPQGPNHRPRDRPTIRAFAGGWSICAKRSESTPTRYRESSEVLP